MIMSVGARKNLDTVQMDKEKKKKMEKVDTPCPVNG